MVSTNLVIINALIWFASLVLPKLGIDLVELLGMHYWRSEEFNLVQVITYMFVHDTSSISHVFFNMFGVWMFGRVVESYWGPARFMTYYLLTGMGAALVQQLSWMYEISNILSNIPAGIEVPGYIFDQFVTIGASGALFGILLAFGMMFPNAPLFLMFIPVPIKAKYMIIGYGLVELFSGVANFTGDSVAHFAHLGGMLFGYILIKVWGVRRIH